MLDDVCPSAVQGRKATLAAPHPESYIGDLALTAEGSIVAIQGDGTSFGVGD